MTCKVHRALFSPTPSCSACFEELERINVAQQFDRVVDGDEFSKARRQPATRTGSLPECAALGRSSDCETRGFPRLSVNFKNAHVKMDHWRAT